MTKSPMLLDPDMLAVRAQYSAALSECAPDLLEAGTRLLDSLSQANWTLEWYLPRWLGDSFGLAPHHTQALVHANVYGLGYIRLQDDLADERLGGDAVLLDTCLAGLLYRLALQQYLPLFDVKSPFWRYLDSFMSEWLHATLSSNTSPVADVAGLADQDLVAIGARGAPLKICCAGACLLGRREQSLPVLLRAVEHALAGHVLLDHFDDWQQDLASERFNLFVAYASSSPQTAARREENEAKVMQEWYCGKQARPYLALVSRQLKMAVRVARLVPCPGLADYLSALQAEAVEKAKRSARAAQERLQAATSELLRRAASASDA